MHQGTYSLLINNSSSSNSSGNNSSSGINSSGSGYGGGSGGGKGAPSESYNCVNEMICQRLSQVRNPFIDLGLWSGAYIICNCGCYITHFIHTYTIIIMYTSA